MPAPVGPEFRLLYDQQNYGMPMPDALKAFAERIPVLDARFFVTAVLIQREAGGNLSEVLDNLARRHSRALPREAPDARAVGARPHHRLGAGRACRRRSASVLMTVNPEHRRADVRRPARASR